MTVSTAELVGRAKFRAELTDILYVTGRQGDTFNEAERLSDVQERIRANRLSDVHDGGDRQRDILSRADRLINIQDEAIRLDDILFRTSGLSNLCD